MGTIRITRPEPCDGVYCTEKAFRGLSLPVRQRLVFQEVSDAELAVFRIYPVFHKAQTLASVLLLKMVTRFPELKYCAMAALDRALSELLKGHAGEPDFSVAAAGETEAHKVKAEDTPA